MRNDARAHGVLSESSVSLHIHAHDRKGDRREERGERKGREGRVETSHHGVTQVTRGARDSATIVAPDPVTAPDAMMSLTAIEHLDFEPEVPCDGARDGELCQNAAFGVVVALCRGCREGGRSFICRRCWAECQTAGWLCPSCDRSCEPRFIRLVVTFR